MLTSCTVDRHPEVILMRDEIPGTCVFTGSGSRDASCVDCQIFAFPSFAYPSTTHSGLPEIVRHAFMPSTIGSRSFSINEEIFMIRSSIVHVTGLYVRIDEDVLMCWGQRHIASNQQAGG